MKLTEVKRQIQKRMANMGSYFVIEEMCHLLDSHGFVSYTDRHGWNLLPVDDAKWNELLKVALDRQKALL